MQIVLIGAVEESRVLFSALLERQEYAKHIAAIITLVEENPQNISGFRTFDDLANRYGKPLHKIKHIRTPEAYELMKSLQPDLLLVLGWSQLVSDEVLR